MVQRFLRSRILLPLAWILHFETNRRTPRLKNLTKVARSFDPVPTIFTNDVSRYRSHRDFIAIYFTMIMITDLYSASVVFH